ncbi:hypothetical protein AMATHDRAFT_73863 [Amanita thiersii Skay4041]|uniref:JmjC domain-containing protein n=1 Tax=Amanita thiersii Skay4041 TaxID=703135 RepID=A0A2A9NXW7_9AGAR|nr:hypothetical protein AMATHDRAFT_73863 [Amanita thiersii Skay4041]
MEPPYLKNDHLQWLAMEYYDLNGSSIEVLERPPTALEFSRLVNASRPVVINGLELSATRKWTNGYLVRKMEMRRISVAVTPDGRADAITEGPDNKLYFVEPFVDHMTMEELLSRLATNSNQSEICYLQSQNGNLYSSTYFGGQAERDPSEFEPLRKDVPPEIPWCSEALDRSPDAVNLWIGDGKSSTSIHCDPYENFYTVVRGAKHFTLLPPTEGYYLKERWYPHGQYTRSSNTDLQMTPSPPTVSHVRWSSILDPNEPQALPPEAHPIHVSLLPGQTLYLPAGWWHHVRQAPEITIALNWWYDTEMRGMSWILLSFMRKLCSPGENCEEESMTN